jgi:hypothetical protein
MQITAQSLLQHSDNYDTPADGNRSSSGDGALVKATQHTGTNNVNSNTNKTNKS